jgi:hypothetical protein
MIELNKGIPEDIDKVDFLDVSQRNLIVLDDLMAQSGKDKRNPNPISSFTYIINPKHLHFYYNFVDLGYRRSLS